MTVIKFYLAAAPMRGNEHEFDLGNARMKNEI